VLTGNGDVVVNTEANMIRPDMAGSAHFPGVGDHGMYDKLMKRQSGRPHVCFRRWEAV